MQRKIPNINFRDKLHSIPINKMKNVKANVLYSIPGGCVAALLLAAISLVPSGSAFADNCTEMELPRTDAGTITAVTGGTTTSPTASLTLSKTTLASDATTPGSIATTSTNVTVDVKNASSYSLTLSFDEVNLTNGSTTIAPGNATSNNTWGYKWDNASSYTAPSTSGQNLIVPALSNSAASFTKTLAFAVKFASNAEAGHYKASGTLSLVATPKATTYTLADLTQMQQLTLAPEACANTPYLSGQTYSAEYKLTDVRDGNTYTVRKFGDGKCWMTQNLRLHQHNTTSPDDICIPGRELNPTTSDVSEKWTLPKSNTSGFSSDTASNAYYDSSVAGGTGYYTWCAATAGSCSSATSNGTNATNSICPKGWKLPTGGTSGNTDFYNLFKNMSLTISSSLATNGNTSWGTGDLAKVQASPYNFAYTGYMYNGSLSNATTSGNWWSRTAGSSTCAYNLRINSSNVNPGISCYNRRSGVAVRCVAQ